jgi:hypothetical protein
LELAAQSFRTPHALRRFSMGILWVIAAIILLFWLGGLIIGVAGNLIHILLVIGLIVLIYSLVTGRRATG